MAKMLTTIDDCRRAFPDQDMSGRFEACAHDVVLRRGHLVEHLGDTPVWLIELQGMAAGNPLLLFVSAVFLLVWLIMLVAVLRARGLRGLQKLGWAVGLTFLFPVFSVLFLALLPASAPLGDRPAA